MANNYIKIGVWVLTTLVATTAYTETESTPAGASTKTQTLPTFSETVVAPAIPKGASPDNVPNADYRPPTHDKSLSATAYPMGEGYDGHEGWTELNMMIDKQGKPYEISVVDSTGSPIFDKTAIRAISNARFTPATLNGEPVEAGFAIKFTFQLANLEKGASAEFARRYRALSSALKRSDRTAADEALKLMKVQNLYEDAFYNLGRFYYLRQWGDDKQQLEALQRAIAYERSSKFLPAKDFQLALAEQFRLQLKTSDFGAALQTFDSFDAAQKSDAEILRMVAGIKALAKDTSAYAVQGEIVTGTSWYYRLLKRHFSILLVKGELAEIKLRCERKYVFARYQPGIDYATFDNYGVCDMELVGSNGAQFTLIQS